MNTTDTTLHGMIAEDVRELSAYAVANMGEGATENDEARAFYEGVRDAYAEAIEYAEGKPSRDAEAEIADGAPSVYNYERMMQLVGTRSYLTAPEIADGGEDILTLAGYALYELARDVIAALAEYYDERAEAIGEAECETCGRTFPDIYPSARCPFEYEHDTSEEED